MKIPKFCFVCVKDTGTEIYYETTLIDPMDEGLRGTALSRIQRVDFFIIFRIHLPTCKMGGRNLSADTCWMFANACPFGWTR